MTQPGDTPEIGLFEAIYSQRAIRSFRPDPVPREVIEQILTAATKAPSGGNSQPWAFVVVQDPVARAEMAGYAREGFQRMYDIAKSRLGPGDPEPFPKLGAMIASFETIPALVVVCGVGDPDRPAGTGFDPSAQAGSVFPAVQNLLLAARGLGVGASLTTGWAKARMPDIRALLALPDHVTPYAFIPLGYPDKERYGPTTRRPLAEVVHWDTYSEKANTAALLHR